MKHSRYSLMVFIAIAIAITALLISGSNPTTAQTSGNMRRLEPLQATATATAAPTDITILPGNPTSTPAAPLVQGTQPAQSTIGGTPVGPSPNINPPPTLDELLKQYPDLKPYLDKIKDVKANDLDFAELYKKIVEIFKDQGASGVATFLKDSGLLEKLGLPLSYLDLLTEYDKGGFDGVIKLAKERKLINDADEVVGYLTVDDKTNLDAVKKDLTDLGVSAYDYNNTTTEIEIGIPLDVLKQFGTPGPLIKYLTQIANVNHIKGFRAPTPVLTTSPLQGGKGALKETVGAQTIGADKWHEAGFTGKGIRIGVLDLGFGGIKNDLGKTLPTIDKIKTNIDIDSLNEQDENHGTACAEIVHGAAPDAELFIAYYDSTSSKSYNAALNFLVKNKVQIITHSVSQLVGPRDGTYGDAPLVDKFVRDTGILWVNSAGNYADSHSRFTFHEGKKGFQTFDNGEFLIPFEAGTSHMDVILNWDGKWGGGEQSEYDFMVVDKSGKQIVAGNELRKGRRNDLPYQFAAFDAKPGDQYYVAVRRQSGSTANTLDLFIPNTRMADWAAVPSYSIASPGDSDSAFTVGATGLTQDEIEPYSSEGPTTDDRQKPDISAPTGEVLPEFPSDEGGFAGTSGSTPLVAGAAALVYQKFPDITAPEVKAFLMNNSIDLGDTGPDDVFGAGRLSMPDPSVDLDGTGTPPATQTSLPTKIKIQPTTANTPTPTKSGNTKSGSSGSGSSGVSGNSGNVNLTFNSVSPSYNIKVDGVIGLQISTSFSLKNYKGKKLGLLAVFNAANGDNLPSADPDYEFEDTIATATTLKVSGNQASFRDVTLFIPNSVFKQVKQKDLVFVVGLFDLTDSNKPTLIGKTDQIKIKIK